MPFDRLVLGVLVVWRITHLLHAEDGPWDTVARLRARAGERFAGRLLDCFYCLSLWTAAPLAAWLGPTAGERLLLWPALSAGAILLERVTARCDPAPPAPYLEDEDVVLRREEEVRREPGRPWS